jgi:hypothetical protein
MQYDPETIRHNDSLTRQVNCLARALFHLFRNIIEAASFSDEAAHQVRRNLRTADCPRDEPTSIQVPSVCTAIGERLTPRSLMIERRSPCAQHTICNQPIAVPF